MNSIFDRKQPTGRSVVGDWLCKHPLANGSKIRFPIEEDAATFVFAWGLLYDHDCSDEAIRSADGFWGLRYVIEQRVIPSKPPEPPVPAKSDFEMGAIYWNFAQWPEQEKFITQLLKGSAEPIKLAGGGPIDQANKARSYLSNCASQVVYFYTHGYTGLPQQENYGFTVNDFIELYNKLPKTSLTRQEWKETYDRIQKRRYRSDNSWIELAYGELKLKQLYQDVTTLPQRPVVLLNMCNSAQVTPSLKQSFIDFFLGRGASAVVGTECSMRPLFADFVGRELLPDLVNGTPIGQALLRVRQKAAKQKNLMGLAYTLFGWADSKPWQFNADVKPHAAHPR